MSAIARNMHRQGVSRSGVIDGTVSLGGATC